MQRTSGKESPWRCGCRLRLPRLSPVRLPWGAVPTLACAGCAASPALSLRVPLHSPHVGLTERKGTYMARLPGIYSAPSLCLSCFLSEAHALGRPRWAELRGPRRCKHRAGLGQPPPPSIHSMRSLETLPVLCSEAESGRHTQSWLLLTPGCLYPLADDGGLQLSCLNHRNRIFGVGGSEVEVVRAPLDGDGND